MMNRLAISLACLMVIGVVSALSVDIDIRESLNGEVTSFSYKEKENLVKFSTELSNTGSVAYTARARIDIIRNDSILFTGWGSEKALLPGNKASFDIFWYSKEAGNFTVRIRMYFGNDIIARKTTIAIGSHTQPLDSFDISSIRTTDDKITFNIANLSTPAVLIPYKYPAGWIFEHAKVERGGSVAINYIPSLWTNNNYLTVMLVSEDGRYMTERTFKMEKSGLWESLSELIKSLFSITLLLQ